MVSNVIYNVFKVYSTAYKKSPSAKKTLGLGEFA